jgi:hypothetical protein
MTRDGEVVRRAATQHGVLHRLDLVDLGVSSKVRRRLLEEGLLERIGGTVYRVAGVDAGWHGRLAVAVVAARDPVRVSGRAAGALWAFPNLAPGVVEITRPRELGRLRMDGVIVHRTRYWQDDHVTERNGLPVTTPARTLLDLASVLRPHHLDLCLEDAARRDLVNLADFHAELEIWRTSGRPGVQSSEDSVFRHVGIPRADSFLEARFLTVLAQHGIPLPETQVDLDLDGIHHRVDTLWRAERLIVELDGHATHSTRTAHNADADRAGRLVAAGYRVVSFTHDHVVRNPPLVVKRMRALLPEATEPLARSA